MIHVAKKPFPNLDCNWLMAVDGIKMVCMGEFDWIWEPCFGRWDRAKFGYNQPSIQKVRVVCRILHRKMANSNTITTWENVVRLIEVGTGGPLTNKM